MYRIDGKGYTAREPGLQQALADAYKTRTRPLCMCTERGVPVCIARTGQGHVVRRMPFTRSLHAIECRHHEPAQIGTHWSEPRVAIRQDLATGMTHIRARFSLSQGLSQESPPRTREHLERTGGGDQRMSWQGLIQFLWQEAELVPWRPAFEGRRSWAVVRHCLLRAASKVVVNGARLQEALFIPEIFRPRDAEQIRVRRALRLDEGFRVTEQVRRKMLLIAEVKAITPVSTGFHVIVKHLPDTPFHMSDQQRRRVVARFGNALSCSRGSTADVRLLMAATLARTEQGQLVLDDVFLTAMSYQWIPLEDLVVSRADRPHLPVSEEQSRRGDPGRHSTSSSTTQAI